MIVCGGGTVGYYLIPLLCRDGISVKVIEKDCEKCEELSAMFPSIDVINGDACSHQLLKSEGISDSDALITITGFDEMNIVISLYGHSKDVPLTVTKLSRLKNSELLSDISLGGGVVCPNELCTNTIVRYVRAMKAQTGAAQAVHFIAGGLAEAMEFRVDETVLNCGKPLKSIKLKKNVLIACITHGTKSVIPDGESSYGVGDGIVVVTKNGDTIYQLNDIFA